MVKRGFAREDLFVCVHEQFMTETAQMADIVLPATMFLEHDDVYQGGGHQYIMLGPKLVEPPGECRSNHDGDLRAGQARRRRASGLRHDAARADRPDAAESGWGTLERARGASNWIDCQPDFETAHYLKGFACPDGKFRFKPDWPKVPFRSAGPCGPDRDDAGAARPLGRHRGGRRRSIRSGWRPPRRATSSTRPSTRRRPRAREARPARGDDPSRRCGARSASPTATRCVLGNARGAGAPARQLFDGVRRGVLIAESIWPNDAYRGRPRHQHADRRRRDRALWRRGVPRQQGLDQAGYELDLPRSGTPAPSVAAVRREVAAEAPVVERHRAACMSVTLADSAGARVGAELAFPHAVTTDRHVGRRRVGDLRARRSSATGCRRAAPYTETSITVRSIEPAVADLGADQHTRRGWRSTAAPAKGVAPPVSRERIGARCASSRR